MKRVLLLDNHDSFTWNLFELLRVSGKVNVSIQTPERLNMQEALACDGIIISPGPGLPQEQPVMLELLNSVEWAAAEKGQSIPVFGVCLGMQAIAIHFGGSLFNLPMVVHGRPQKLRILQPEYPLFNGIPDGCEVGLYHSWAINSSTLPSCLNLLAVNDAGTIMAIAHKSLPVCGVQFHPESIMTACGQKMLANWLDTF